jgi:8-oxo-dGTP diphosphatase
MTPARLCWLIENYRPAGGLQWIGIGATAKLVKGVPRRTEPDKSGEWGWYDLDKLPAPLYQPTAGTIEAYRTGEIWHE